MTHAVSVGREPYPHSLHSSNTWIRRFKNQNWTLCNA